MSEDLTPHLPPLLAPPGARAHFAIPQSVRVALLGMILIAALPLGILVGTLHAHTAPRPPVVVRGSSSNATHATITFTRMTIAAHAPQTTLVAANSGGQIPTIEIAVTVRQATSAPIAATAQNGQYSVPANCGDAGPADRAALAGLQAKLSSQTPGGTITFYGPGFSVDAGSLTCQPAAGTTQPQPFYYTEQIDGSAVQVVYRLSDAQLFQIDQMTQTLPPHYVITATSTCNDIPTTTGSTRYTVTIVCPTTGMAAWDWPSSALAALAQHLIGLTPAQARALLDHTPGIVPGSAQVTLQGGTTLPVKSTQCDLVVNG